MSSGTTQTQAEFDAEEALHYRAVLRTLVDLGTKVAVDMVADAAAAKEAGTPKPQLTIPLERVSRTIRRCILLARKLAEPLPKPRAATTAPLDRTAARKRIIRTVDDAIDHYHRMDGVDVERLEAELLDRLDRPDVEADLATRPIEHVIADIGRDLGCGFPLDEKFFVWKRRTPEDLEILEARAAAPLPTEPRPPRTKTRAPPPKPIQLPDDHAEAVAMVLKMGKRRNSSA